MQRNSETIGAIAAALAKAQVELTNPEKSLVATIRARDPREGEQRFRYAPLSSGLDIVRKCLGQHEIATVQTTAIDREVGLIRLTTLLAHSSGEWMSSDWPVCPIADASAPQRMGAALTYARRYALFTLVGIAGEDDLDAPDLPGVQANAHAPKAPADERAGPPVGANGHAAPSPTASAKHVRQAGSSRPPQPILAVEASALCRDRVLGEMAEVTTADQLAAWAQRVLPTKNTLRTEDAAIVERAFTDRLGQLADGTEPDIQGPRGGLADVPPSAKLAPSGPREAQAEPAERAAGRPDIASPSSAMPDANCADLAFGKMRRKRDKDHRAFVASKACLVCGRHPADAHHVRFAQPRALGRKVSDEFTVPLCRIHHRELHMRADEVGWWTQHAIDPIQVARGLWQQTQAEAVTAAGDEGSQAASGVNSQPESHTGEAASQ